ncbi:uncharacterized protein PAC_15841 [Phialocephala subalpina]|uniref:Uncharacterized protein n=1 Tax=Phialocephala subalpina TaxID=576137 RepID=A0A1L7XLK7_9HELO|nr:uncharacterized protein PAC_15841 [Phialocephala subalpina]
MAPFGDFMKGVVTYLAGTATLTKEFANNNVAPIIGDAATSIKEFNREKFTPALSHILDETNKVLDGFGRHLGPALLLTGDALTEFQEKHLGPAISVSVATLNDLGEKEIIPGLYVTSATLKELHEKQLSPALAALAEFGREKLAPALDEAGKWIQDHPGEMVVIASAGLIVVYPGLVTTPTLWVLGFGSEGVGADTAAALVHSYIGDVAAGSVFATLQSAGAAGYGVVIVDGVASAGALTVGALKIFDAIKGDKPLKGKL